MVLSHLENCPSLPHNPDIEIPDPLGLTFPDTPNSCHPSVNIHYGSRIQNLKGAMNRLKAAFAVTIVIVSFSTVGATAGTDTLPAESGPTAIDSCTTISESGRYVITRDLTYDPFEHGNTCIRVNASDVVVDGQGYTVIDDASANAVVVGADERRLSNVTVRNINVGDVYDFTHAVAYEGVDGGAIINVTVRDPVVLALSSNISVRESTVHGGGVFTATNDPAGRGLTVVNTSGVVIAGNTFTGSADVGSIGVVGSRNTTIRNNSLLGCPECGSYEPPLKDQIDTTDAPPSPTGYAHPPYRGILIGEAVGTTVVNNTIRHYVTGIYLDHEISDREATRIANNTIRRNIAGLRIDVTKRPVVIRHNEIVDNAYGIYTPELDVCEPDTAGTENVQIHRNDIANNNRYGILNERTATLNATRNYWGAESGPSSANDSDAPFADPVTGTLADGEGDIVSEHPKEPGVSNVHFDPAREESVTNSSAESAS